MYSLYRAWLSLGPCGMLPGNIPGLQNDLHLGPSSASGAPDVNLRVGPTMTHFSAHKSILASQSGFFKAALSNHTGYEPISVPNVNVDEFSSLLTFMYTGFLDLNLSNIYSILLATHILHMPSAIEICRRFLLQHQRPEPRTNIVKPIPSRKSIVPLSQIRPPLFGNLQQHTETPFQIIPVHRENPTYTYYPNNSETAKNDDKPGEAENEKIEKPRDPKTPGHRKEGTEANASKENVSTKKKSEENAGKVSSASYLFKKTSSSSSNAKSKKRCSPPSDEKIEIDVACCDGPVRFHRVLNKNFGHAQQATDSKYQTVVSKNAAINRIMNENIREQNKDDDDEEESFKCLYCNHVFKSRYCYQKHARRHLNPVPDSSKAIEKVENANATGKREVKLLDLNVQYYPCKMCGSKFPSYYFVHKHRKLCHSNGSGGNGGEDETGPATIERGERKSECKENDDDERASEGNAVGSEDKEGDVGTK